MQKIAFQQSPLQAVIAWAQSDWAEQTHTAHAVASGRCGVHIGTLGVGWPGGIATGGIVGVPLPAVIGAIGTPCGGEPVPGGSDPPGARDPAVPATHWIPTQGGEFDGAFDPLTPGKSEPGGLGSSGVEEQPKSAPAQSRASQREDSCVTTMGTRMRTVSRAQAE